MSAMAAPPMTPGFAPSFAAGAVPKTPQGQPPQGSQGLAGGVGAGAGPPPDNDCFIAAHFSLMGRPAFVNALGEPGHWFRPQFGQVHGVGDLGPRHGLSSTMTQEARDNMCAPTVSSFVNLRETGLLREVFVGGGLQSIWACTGTKLYAKWPEGSNNVYMCTVQANSPWRWEGPLPV